MKVTVLAGGVGAARFTQGLADIIGQENVTAVVNVGDDIEVLGLKVSPDLDIITYTLAGLIDEGKGWGFADDGFRALEMLRRYGSDIWMMLGDMDLATHIYRTFKLRLGTKLSEVTAKIAEALGVKARILPATDDKVTTLVQLTDGRLVSFEEYYVRLKFKPRINGIIYRGCSTAVPAHGVLEELEEADSVIIAPSNPLASIMPILCIGGIRARIRDRTGVAAISPIVGGRAIKGPADKMMRELDIEPSPVGVARLYRDLVDLIVMDSVDDVHADAIRAMGIDVHSTNTLMIDRASRARLAKDVLRSLGYSI